jgi:hypothetical protein
VLARFHFCVISDGLAHLSSSSNTLFA